MRALVVDDERVTRRLVERLLERAGFAVQTAGTAAEALAAVEQGFQGVVVLDVRLPDQDGTDLLPRLKALAPDNPVVLLTSYGSAALALGSLQEGAFDFLDKSRLEERLVESVQRAAEQLARAPAPPRLLTGSRRMQPVFHALESATRADVPALILGESGTGKELLARALHEGGRAAAGPFVAVNCAGIPENLLEAELFGYEKGAFTGAEGRKPGRFDLAAGGTLFLDEIGEMHPRLQAKLLRVLQQGEYQRLGGVQTLQARARIVAATHRDLERAVAAGEFRQDLYYRLAVFVIELPPLREREGDTRLLAEHFLRARAAAAGRDVAGIDPRAMELIEGFDFPGNVRELENLITYAVLSSRGPIVTLADLPAPFLRAAARKREGGAPPDGPASEAEFPTLQELERRHIAAALARCGGNRSEAARLLGIARMTLYRKLREHGLDEGGGRATT